MNVCQSRQLLLGHQKFKLTSCWPQMHYGFARVRGILGGHTTVTVNTTQHIILKVSTAHWPVSETTGMAGQSQWAVAERPVTRRTGWSDWVY